MENLPSFEDSLEAVDLIQEQFLDFQLEDKLVFEERERREGGGGRSDGSTPRVKPGIKNVYVRRINTNGPRPIQQSDVGTLVGYN